MLIYPVRSMAEEKPARAVWSGENRSEENDAIGQIPGIEQFEDQFGPSLVSNAWGGGS